MGRKHHRKKHYYSITDRPAYKIVASILTGLVFVLLYYLVVLLMENPGAALILSVPCVLMLIWVAIKQRNFWWLWIVVACPCGVLIVLVEAPQINFLLQSLYWAVSYAMSQWLIVADSRAKSHSRSKGSSHHHHHHHHTSEPKEPRPKDELLEQLFANAE